MWLDLPIIKAKYFGSKFKADPVLFVIHCGSASDGIAEYFKNPGDSRKVSTHFASTKSKQLVQCVDLDNVAWHCGRWNSISLGVELPSSGFKTGWDEDIYEQLYNIVNLCTQVYPSLMWAVGHVELDPKNRRDPGPKFDWDGLESNTNLIHGRP